MLLAAASFHFIQKHGVCPDFRFASVGTMGISILRLDATGVSAQPWKVSFLRLGVLGIGNPRGGALEGWCGTQLRESFG